MSGFRLPACKRRVELLPKHGELREADWESIDVDDGSNCILSESDRILLYDSNDVLIDAVRLEPR